MQKKFKIINIILFCVVIPVLLVVGYFFFGTGQYYIVAALIILFSLVMFFASFEKRHSKTREIVAIAALTAVAVVSRGAFYMLPQIKPIGAVVLLAGLCFGCETGFSVGCLSMFLSDLFFGVGSWTPFQMFGMGLAALIFGLIFSNSNIRHNRFIIGISGGLIVFVVYGFVVDTGSVFLVSSDLSLGSVLSVYGAGLPFNAIFGGTTAILLVLFGNTFSEKLERVKVKYGIFERKDNK